MRIDFTVAVLTYDQAQELEAARKPLRGWLVAFALINAFIWFLYLDAAWPPVVPDIPEPVPPPAATARESASPPFVRAILPETVPMQTN